MKYIFIILFHAAHFSLAPSPSSLAPHRNNLGDSIYVHNIISCPSLQPSTTSIQPSNTNPQSPCDQIVCLVRAQGHFVYSAHVHDLVTSLLMFIHASSQPSTKICYRNECSGVRNKTGNWQNAISFTKWLQLAIPCTKWLPKKISWTKWFTEFNSITKWFTKCNFVDEMVTKCNSVTKWLTKFNFVNEMITKYNFVDEIVTKCHFVHEITYRIQFRTQTAISWTKWFTEFNSVHKMQLCARNDYQKKISWTKWFQNSIPSRNSIQNSIPYTKWLQNAIPYTKWIL